MTDQFPSDEIENLIKRASSGDRDAVSVLYQRYVDRVFRYVVYRVSDQDAEDVTADVFVRMVEALSSYTYTGVPFEAWLYRIAAARVADFHRRRQRRQHDELPESIRDSEPMPEEHLVELQEQEDVRAALKGLSEDEQTILILRFVERMSHTEVAAIVGKSATAVRTMQHRALTRLSQQMDAGGKARHYLRGITGNPDDQP